MYKTLFLLCAPLLFSQLTYAKETFSKVIVMSDIQWGYLNPLRGALSPGAANLWGDRSKTGASGMLVRFNKGFESPPHIHNITYRGVVIDGLLHNDDPQSEKMWMPSGSFWTQPAGEDHTTAAKGEKNLIYLEIDSGPYLVKPSSMAFDNGDQPLNLHRKNIVWLSNNNSEYINSALAKQSFVWGNPAELSGSMVKLPPKFAGQISTAAKEFRAVIITGSIKYSSKEQEQTTLEPGSYIESVGSFVHKIETKGHEEAMIYIRTDSQYRVN